MIRFFIPLRRIPTVTQQEHKVTVRGGKPHFYEPAELKAARQLFRDHLCRYRPNKPLQGPVYLETSWMFPAGTRHHNGEWKCTKPDTDNLVKMLKDEMTRLGFWKDDSQVAAEVIQKRWSDQSGLLIILDELDLMEVSDDQR